MVIFCQGRSLPKGMKITTHAVRTATSDPDSPLLRAIVARKTDGQLGLVRHKCYDGRFIIDYGKGSNIIYPEDSFDIIGEI